MLTFPEINEKIAATVVQGYRKIETVTANGFEKIQAGAVNGFIRLTDRCIQILFAREGESVADARKRLSERNKTTQN